METGLHARGTGRNLPSWLWGLAVVALLVVPAAEAGVTMAGLGSFSISATAPATGIVGYYGNAVAFVPANEDSIDQPTLVITWAQTDPNNGSRRLFLFHRITIPPANGTPTILCTATLPSDVTIAGTPIGATTAGTRDLIYDPVTKKIVGSMTVSGNRAFAFDLFSTNVTLASVSYSAATGDSQAFNEVFFLTNDGKYTSFYSVTTPANTWRKITIGRNQLDGVTAWAKTDITKTSFTGWWPDPAAYGYNVDGFNCSGGAAFYGSSALILRSYKNSLNSNYQESRLYLVGQALDAPAINAYTDLGAVAGMTNNNYIAFGMAFDKGNRIAYVRCGYINNSGSPSYNRIFMASVAPDPDAIAPNPVTDLAATTDTEEPRQVTLTWTAPLDTTGIYDGAVSYDVRYSTSLIDDTNWDAATQATGEPQPSSAGTTDTMVVTGLMASTTYYFAVKSSDTSGNVSALSNVFMVTTPPPDLIPPAPVTNLAVSMVKPTRVTLTWTATADDGTNAASGPASLYDLRYSTGPIDDGNFASATQVTGLAAPKACGSAESVTVTGLTPDTTYYFAIKVVDDWPNTSAISNLPSAALPVLDIWPPNAITDLAVTGTGVRTVTLQWTTPAEVGAEGLAGYDIRYSTATYPAEGTTQEKEDWFAAATPVTNEPAPAATGTLVTFKVGGLLMDTQYYLVMKAFDGASPANLSVLSNMVPAHTNPQVNPITIHNPWITNDRIADTRSLDTMAATFGNAYTPDGVIPGATDQDKVINEYNNFKRREYHWGDDPPNRGDVVENINVFGHSLCGGQATQNSTILNAMGIHARTVTIPGHTIYEAYYNNAWHLLDTMTTMYCFTRTTPPTIASCDQIKSDGTLLTSAVADGRACPGFLLCPDDPVWYANGLKSWGVLGDPGSTPVAWSMNMDLHFGETFYRGWDSWLNQHTPMNTSADSLPGPDAPYHHDAARDWKDTVNFPYWEPYTLNQTENYALNIGHSVSYRRWSNGIYTLAPDFGTAGYQAMIYSSSNIATLNGDGLTPDLHPAATGSLANVVLHVKLPFYITDCNISGDFTRTAGNDINKIYFGTTSNPTTVIWTNTSMGTTHLENLNIRSSVYGKFEFYIKIELQSTNNINDAGVANLVVNTIYEHVKHSMAQLDKGVNHITVTFDNPQDLTGNCAFKVTYRWKEYDGTGWTIDKVREQYVPTSPFTYTITTGGTKVPRTESITMEVCEPPPPCDLVPAAITDLAVVGHDSSYLDLQWLAVLDPCSHSQAAAYDLRYSTSPIDAGNFASATAASGLGDPGPAGATESFQVSGLQPDTTYYFALKVKSFGGSWGDISNVATGHTDLPDVTAPAWVPNLVAKISKTGGGVDLAWTASGDDGNVGKAASYDLSYSTDPITEATFASATAVAGVPAPKTAGSAETFTVTGLTGGTFYYFAIKVSDEVPNVSEISNTTYAYASGIGEKVLQNGLNGYNGCRDNYVESGNPTVKYGAFERMRVSGYGDLGDTERGFIRFDLSSIPAGTTIRTATMKLYSYNVSKMQGSTGYYGAYPFTRAFDELTSNYNYANATTAWTAPGGDFVGTPDALSPKNPDKVPQWYTWDVTSRVQNWINTPAGNLGWCVRCLVETSHCQDEFYQSDTQQAAYRPMLIVSDYVEPQVGDINGDGGIDVIDLLIFVDSFGYNLGERGYDPKCDLSPDGTVDVVDLLSLVENWPQ